MANFDIYSINKLMEGNPPAPIEIIDLLPQDEDHSKIFQILERGDFRKDLSDQVTVRSRIARYIIISSTDLGEDKIPLGVKTDLARNYTDTTGLARMILLMRSEFCDDEKLAEQKRVEVAEEISTVARELGLYDIAFSEPENSEVSEEEYPDNLIDETTPDQYYRPSQLTNRDCA